MLRWNPVPRLEPGLRICLVVEIAIQRPRPRRRHPPVSPGTADPETRIPVGELLFRIQDVGDVIVIIAFIHLCSRVECIALLLHHSTVYGKRSVAVARQSQHRTRTLDAFSAWTGFLPKKFSIMVSSPTKKKSLSRIQLHKRMMSSTMLFLQHTWGVSK